ncbi:MAG: serine O-acetyltransferase [Pseudomonadales bacterium]|nr:serine O-acetyltransferase [Pseudomonadales bacterium]
MHRDPRTTISSDARENPCNLSLWQTVVAEVREQVKAEPLLASFLYSTILNHRDLAAAISFHLANKLASDVTPALMLREIFDDAFARQPDIIDAARSDIIATYERDSACLDFSTPLLYFKGFHALTAHRVAHWLWRHEHRNLALVLQNRISVAFGVDIHPAARIGKGILLDHATGVVIGETAVVEDGVSMMQSVTLGGTGKETGDRHPKIRRGVLIGPGAKILGNIEVGAGAKIIAASVVLQPVPARAVAAGVPARVIGLVAEEPARKMDHGLEGCSGL